MFKVGDIVTGVDRGYQRSLYKVISFGDPGEFNLLFMCLGGRLGRPSDISEQRAINEFRYAEPEEIKEQLGLALSINLIRFTQRLIYTKRSDQVRQSLELLANQL